MSEERLLYRIRITGHVQGVGFRWSALRVARALGITGLVRNMPDGSVYTEAEGTIRQLEDYLAWCRKGPRTGFVDRVVVEKVPPAGYTEFRVDH